MKIPGKRAASGFVFLAMLCLVLASCKAHRGSCPAYGGESSRYKVERVYTR